MSDQTALLSLPYIMPAQAQKHLTHNEALRQLDALVQLAVASATQAMPPGTPEPGARHILPAAAQGAWAGQGAGQLAVFNDGAWAFLAPRAGWLAWVVDVGRLLVFDGTGWIAAQADPVFQNLPQVGIGTAADATNRLAVAGAATLLTHSGAGHQVKVNKATAADTASLLFQSGWSGRAEMGLTGNDDFRIKVSGDGATFHEAVAIARDNGRVELAAPLVLPVQNVTPTPPDAGRIAVYARTRAGHAWLDVQGPTGRNHPLQPHLGVQRIATWAPATGATVAAHGMAHAVSGTLATPALTTSGLATSIRRWQVTSGVAAGAAAQEHAGNGVCWRGNAPGLGGFSYVSRISLVALQSTGMGFFGLQGTASVLSDTMTLAGMMHVVGIGFTRGTHANWQIVHNDGTGAPSLIDLGAGFAIANPTAVLTLHVNAAPQAATIGIRVIEEVSGNAIDAVISTDLPGDSQMLGPRNYLNNGGTAAAVSYACSGVYVETDF